MLSLFLPLLFAVPVLQASFDLALTDHLTSSSVAVVDTLQIVEWTVPWKSSRPRDPYVAPDGRVWFCGQAGGYIGVLDPRDGSFEQFDLGEGAGPHNLIVDDAGMVWYAGNRRAHIGKLNPESGEITKFQMPEPDARDPHTLIFDHNGHIWFTLQQSNMVGRLHMTSGNVEIIRVPTPGARPYGIKMAPDGFIWVALFGTNKLARIDPDNLHLSEIELSRPGARPRRLEITQDGAVWFVDYAEGFLGRYDAVSGEIVEWKIKGSGQSRPYGTAIDENGVFWFVDGGSTPNQFIGFDTRSRVFTSRTAIPSGGGTVRHMYFHSASREIWFGTDTNTIGKAMIPE